MERNVILGEMDSKDLIEVAYAINSDTPGKNQKAKELCIKIHTKATLSNYSNLGVLLAGELGLRLKIAMERREREIKYDHQLGIVNFKY